MDVTIFTAFLVVISLVAGIVIGRLISECKRFAPPEGGFYVAGLAKLSNDLRDRADELDEIGGVIDKQIAERLRQMAAEIDLVSLTVQGVNSVYEGPRREAVTD